MKKIYYILLVCFTVACNSENNTTEQENTENTAINTNEIVVTKKQFEVNNMKLGTPTLHNFNQYVLANGFIDVPPQNKASIRTFMAGYVKKSPLLVGDKVNKGGLLLTLENPEYITLQQEYMEVHEQLDFLKSEFKRQEQLFKENIASEKVFLKAKSAYNTAVAKQTGLEKKLQLLNLSPANVAKGNFSSVINIYAPITGTISKLTYSIGSYVSPTDELLEIVNNDHLHLELEVFEKDILKVEKEMPVLFKVLEASDKTFEAKVHLLGNTISNDKTVKIHGHIKNEKELNFTVGMYVNAKIITGKKEATAIPLSAINKQSEADVILVLEKEDKDGYHFKKYPVKNAVTDETMLAIPNDLANKKILISGAKSL